MNGAKIEVTVEGEVGPLDKEGLNLDSLGEYRVRAHNNDVTTFHEVVMLLVTFCGYPPETGQHYAHKIHTLGQAVVFWGKESRCLELVTEFQKIGVMAGCEKND